MEENKTNIETEISENVKAINQNNIPNGRKKKSKLGLVLIVILLLAAIGFGIWYFIFNQKDEKANDDKTTTTTTTVNKNIVWEDKEISSNSEKTIKIYKSKDDSKLLGFFINGELKNTYKVVADNYSVGKQGQYFGGYYDKSVSIDMTLDDTNTDELYDIETGKVVAKISHKIKEVGNITVPAVSGYNPSKDLIEVRGPENKRSSGEYLFVLKNQDSNKYGVIDQKGKIVADFEYDAICDDSLPNSTYLGCQYKIEAGEYLLTAKKDGLDTTIKIK